MLKRSLITLAISVVSILPAFAHVDPVAHGSLAAGLTHPLFGLDHVLAMVAVGLWAAQRGGHAVWLVPAAFVTTMAVGFVAALAGLALPAVEPAILASVVFFGVAIALALPVPLPAMTALVGFFALFHGHAHGGELGGAGAWQFALGFVLATIALHLAGIAAGLVASRLSNTLLTRIAGATTALAGLWLSLAA